MTAFDLLSDFAIMSLLLVIAQFLRAHIKPIQKLLLPSSVVAGLIGLVLGPQCLNLLPLSSHASSYSGVLIVILFSSLFIGIESMGSFKQTMKEAGDTFLLNSAVCLCTAAGRRVYGSLLPAGEHRLFAADARRLHRRPRHGGHLRRIL